MDTTAFFKLTYGLYIVTSKDGEHESGCVMNTMTQVTAEPAQVCITLNKENYTTQLIEKSGVFNVSVLLDDVSMDLIRQFGFKVVEMLTNLKTLSMILTNMVLNI